MKGKTPSITTAAAVEAISCNDDLLLEILILLPSKSLIRFKSVSKHLYSLISDASFCRLHTRRHPRPRTSFLLHVDRPSRFFHYNPTRKNFVPFHPSFEIQQPCNGFSLFDSVEILQSCNGLLLLKSGCRYKNNYYVYNPTTREFRNLLVPKDEKFRRLFLAFDPLKSHYYKVVCLRPAPFDMCTSPHYEIQVYDSEKHKWHDGNVNCNVRHDLKEWVYSDSDNCIYALSVEDNSLVCFDIEKLMFGKPYLEGSLDVWCISESFGHVYCIFRGDDSNLVVNEMSEKNGEWSFKHLFGFDSYGASSSRRKICFIGVIGGEKKEEQSLVFHIPGKIMAYRFLERTFEELLDLSTQRVCKNGLLPFRSKFYQFVESLAPV